MSSGQSLCEQFGVVGESRRRPVESGGRFGSSMAVPPWGKKIQEQGSPGGVREIQLSMPPSQNRNRSAARLIGKRSTMAFAAVSGPFKIYIHQLNLEEKVLSKAAQSGRATVMVMDYKPRDNPHP